jgi:hypothetical protein
MIRPLRPAHGRFISGKNRSLRLVTGGIGTHPQIEMPVVPLDSLTKFGADTQYKDLVRAPHTVTWGRPYPWILHSSNRTTEHNIFNSWPVIVVGQLAGQTSPPDMRRIVSRRIRLPQSMQGGA